MQCIRKGQEKPGDFSGVLSEWEDGSIILTVRSILATEEGGRLPWQESLSSDIGTWGLERPNNVGVLEQELGSVQGRSQGAPEA